MNSGGAGIVDGSEKIFELLFRYSGKRVSEKNLDLKIVDDLGLDSFAIVELIYEIELLFGAKVSQEELRKIRTVGDILKLCRGLGAAN